MGCIPCCLASLSLRQREGHRFKVRGPRFNCELTLPVCGIWRKLLNLSASVCLSVKWVFGGGRGSICKTIFWRDLAHGSVIAVSLPSEDRVTSSHPAPDFLIHFFFGYLLGTCVPGRASQVFLPGESPGQRSLVGYPVHRVTKSRTRLKRLSHTHAHARQGARGLAQSPCPPGI